MDPQLLQQQLDAGDEEGNNFSSIFTPIEVLGQGSFGRVIRSVCLETSEELAVKVISKKRMSEESVAKVQQEARILESLQHPNVIKFKGVYQTYSKVLIAMELIKGGSLAQLMQNRRKSAVLATTSEESPSTPLFREKEVAGMMKSILLGLSYIHSRNIVHRDLKPVYMVENILIGEVGNWRSVKIADFGLSSAFSLCTTNGLTEQCGTLLYMAPEFFVSRTYSKQIDLWSTAIIMYYLLDGGGHPFYQPKHDNSDTFRVKLASPVKWNFPVCFSELSQSLLVKLSLINPTERYSAVQALQHPFITQSLNGIIPLTVNEQLICFRTTEKLHQVMVSLFMLRFMQTKQQEREKQEREDAEAEAVEDEEVFAASIAADAVLQRMNSRSSSMHSSRSSSIDRGVLEAHMLDEAARQGQVQGIMLKATSVSSPQLRIQMSAQTRKPPLAFMIKKSKQQQQGQVSLQPPTAQPLRASLTEMRREHRKRGSNTDSSRSFAELLQRSSNNMIETPSPRGENFATPVEMLLLPYAQQSTITPHVQNGKAQKQFRRGVVSKENMKNFVAAANATQQESQAAVDVRQSTSQIRSVIRNRNNSARHQKNETNNVTITPLQSHANTSAAAAAAGGGAGVYNSMSPISNDVPKRRMSNVYQQPQQFMMTIDQGVQQQEQRRRVYYTKEVGSSVVASAVVILQQKPLQQSEEQGNNGRRRSKTPKLMQQALKKPDRILPAEILNISTHLAIKPHVQQPQSLLPQSLRTIPQKKQNTPVVQAQSILPQYHTIENSGNILHRAVSVERQSIRALEMLSNNNNNTKAPQTAAGEGGQRKSYMGNTKARENHLMAKKLLNF